MKDEKHIRAWADKNEYTIVTMVYDESLDEWDVNYIKKDKNRGYSCLRVNEGLQKFVYEVSY